MKKLRFLAAFLCLLMINIIPVNAAEVTTPPKVVDGAELLTEDEENALTSKINEIVNHYQIDVVIATEYDRTASSSQDEADLMYDNGGYGIGESKDGILFLVVKNAGEWAISTTGNAIGMFSDYDTEKLGGNAASRYFSNGEFYQGFDSYLSELDVKLDRALNTDADSDDVTAGTTDVPAMPETWNTEDSTLASSSDTESQATAGSYILPALIAGLIITIISMTVMKSGMKTARMQNNADAYQQKNAASEIERKDVFLTSSISKRRLPENNNNNNHHSSHSTTTVHRSSNGHTHGGSSGKF